MLRYRSFDKTIQDHAIPRKSHHQHQLPSRVPFDGLLFQRWHCTHLPLQEQHGNHARCCYATPQSPQRSLHQESRRCQEHNLPPLSTMDLQHRRRWKSTALDLIFYCYSSVLLFYYFFIFIHIFFKYFIKDDILNF